MIVDLERAAQCQGAGGVRAVHDSEAGRDAAKQSQIFAVNNRGNNLQGLLTATTASQVSGTDAGYAMTEGFVVVDAGWEGDVIPAASKLVASLPRARNADGTPITGPMRYEYSDRAAGSFTTNLERNAAFLSYEAADTNTAHATFTVADSEYGPKTPIPADRWAFGSCPTGQTSLVPTNVDLCYFDGFDNQKIYIIYQAANHCHGTRFRRHTTSLRSCATIPTMIAILTCRQQHPARSCGVWFADWRLFPDYIYLGFNEGDGARCSTEIIP